MYLFNFSTYYFNTRLEIKIANFAFSEQMCWWLLFLLRGEELIHRGLMFSLVIVITCSLSSNYFYRVKAQEKQFAHAEVPYAVSSKTTSTIDFSIKCARRPRWRARLLTYKSKILISIKVHGLSFELWNRPTSGHVGV